MFRRIVLWLATGIGMFGMAACSHGETITFSRGRRAFDIEFVTIGNPGNPADEPDHTGLAMDAVDYVYQISKFELSNEAYAVATAVPSIPRTSSLPAGDSWENMAQIVNWLNTSTGYPAAYKFDGGTNHPWTSEEPGYDPKNPTRNSSARYFIPTADEWHKAAYYDPLLGIYYDYANGSNTLPIGVTVPTTNQDEAVYSVIGPAVVDVMQAGGLSPYGTMGQTGNGGEWEEGYFFPGGPPSFERAFRTSGQNSASNLSAANSRQRPWTSFGLRVVSLVPEPSWFLGTCFAALSLLGFRKR